MAKIQSYVTLVLHNVWTTLSNIRKNKGTTKCDKSTVTSDIGIAQYEVGTMKCKRK